MWVWKGKKHPMMAELVPAAQYLRMSTEHQQYSITNQAAAIQLYAQAHGFAVVQTYSDHGRSGLVLKRRSGLRQLLQDVVSRECRYKTILVYDVSRWGRFQDADEAAHYEFLCKQAGIPVHYCNETFSNDTTMPNLIMKALKRTMAGEYSRELSGKVFEGHKRLARLGFKQGGLPGYALRRMLLSSDRRPKQQLADGEHKSIATDRVVLIPGPTDEVEIVREIYRLFVDEKRSIRNIMLELNVRGVPKPDGSTWKYGAVRKILTHPKYSGAHVYGATSQKLCTPAIHLPRSQWVITPRAIQPIIEPEVFEAAQQIQEKRTKHLSNDDMLNRLRRLLKLRGRLSQRVIERSRLVPAYCTYRARFGSLKKAYELIGYGEPEHFSLPTDLRRRTQAIRHKLIAQIHARFPNDLTVRQKSGRSRSLLYFNGKAICAVMARCVRLKQGLRWIVQPSPNEADFPALLVRLNRNNNQILDSYMFPRLKNEGRFQLTKNDAWLAQGVALRRLSDFCTVAERLLPV
jgi:DNA invertase Pin-like site-specific DNA recombinase